MVELRAVRQGGFGRSAPGITGRGRYRKRCRLRCLCAHVLNPTTARGAMHRNRPSMTWRPSPRRSWGNIGPSAIQLLMALLIVYGWHPCPSISAESAAATADSYWPRVASIEPPRTSPADRETPLQFAAGAVQFNLPAGWSARQIPHEREMRLVLRPPDAEREGGSVSEGLWMTYHAIARTEEPYPSELERWMPARLSPERDWSVAIGSPRRYEVDQWPALEQRFEFQPPASTTTWVGRHLLVRTDWGIVELHASAPTPRADRLDTEVERLVSGLQLAAPLRPAESINNAACLATPVLGTWRVRRA